MKGLECQSIGCCTEICPKGLDVKSAMESLKKLIADYKKRHDLN